MALNLIVLAHREQARERRRIGSPLARHSQDLQRDMLRGAAQAGTEIGKRAKAIMDRGELISDDVMIGIVRERLDQKDAAQGFVLDGFPRTVAQASALDELMRGRDPLIVIDIAVPEAELMRRMLARLICESCGLNAAPDADRSDRAAAAAGDWCSAPTTTRRRCWSV